MEPATFCSLLFAPAHESRKVEKALASDAKHVALDFEEAVPAEQKQAAREAVSTLPAAGRKPFIRVNGLATALAADDFAALPADRIAGVIMPMVSTAEDLARAAQLLHEAEQRAGVPEDTLEMMPIIETGRAVAFLSDMLRNAPQCIKRLSFGARDYTRDTGILYTRDEDGLTYARQHIVVQSRAAGLAPPIDAAFPNLDDGVGFEASCMRARTYGFAGKACIHPAQLEVANQVFSLKPDQIDEAQAMAATYENALAQQAASDPLGAGIVSQPMSEAELKMLTKDKRVELP